LPNREVWRLPGPNSASTHVETELITPRSPVSGTTFERDQAQRERERLHRPAPGASVRIPF